MDLTLTASQFHATRLQGVGRPRMVTVSRPLSLCTASSRKTEIQPPQERPATPVRPCREISAFSPCSPDTISTDCSRMSLSRSVTLQIRCPAPLTPHRRPPCDAQTRQRSASWHSRSLLGSLKPSPTELEATLASSVSFSTYPSTVPTQTPPPVHSLDAETAAWARCRKLEDTIAAVSSAIDTFPDGMLRLDSPSILTLRNPDSLDELTIDALRRVFPQTATLLLSALAALLVLDLYLSSLGDTRVLIGEICSTHPQEKYWSLPVKTNDCLHDIPTKARATLDIHVPNATRVQVHGKALRRRAETVAVCVRVLGQKLLEAICGRYDEILWRTLKILVDTLERLSI